jgi:hypothetical protein
MDLDIVSDDQSAVIERLVPNHAEVLAVQCSVGGESGSGIAPGILRDAIKRTDERDFFGHAAQGEVADHFIGLSLFLIVLHLVGDRRELFDIQEVGIAEMRIAFFVIRVDGLGIDRGFDRFEGLCVRIHVDETTVVHEPSRRFGDHHVSHTKFDHGVIRIDVPTSRFRLSARGKASQQTGYGESLHPVRPDFHIFTFLLLFRDV